MNGGRRRHVLVRVDASATAGTGHFVRGVTLARALDAAGWQTVVSVKALPDALLAVADGCTVVRAPTDRGAGSAADAEEVLAHGPDLVVCDGYQFAEEFFAVLRARGCPYAVVDDNVETTAPDPVAVVNQNPHASASMYARLTGEPLLLLGLRYVLLREQIRAAADRRDAHPRRDVFVSLGGSDPLGATVAIVEALASAPLRVDVAVGAATANRAAVLRRLGELPQATVVEQADFASAFAGAAVAVVGAGTSLWEAAHLGIPTIGVVVADNQAAPAAAAAELGFVHVVDARAELVADRVTDVVADLLRDPDRSAEMSRRGRTAVDGHGAARVAEALTTRCAGEW